MRVHACLSRVLPPPFLSLWQVLRTFTELNYWGKTSDNMSVGTYIDPNTTPLWSPSIPVSTVHFSIG